MCILFIYLCELSLLTAFIQFESLVLYLNNVLYFLGVWTIVLQDPFCMSQFFSSCHFKEMINFPKLFTIFDSVYEKKIPKLILNYQKTPSNNLLSAHSLSNLCKLHTVIEFMIPIEDNEKCRNHANVSISNVYSLITYLTANSVFPRPQKSMHHFYPQTHFHS